MTIPNEKYRFEVNDSKSWSFKKIIQQDPYKEMKSGLYGASPSIGKEEKKEKTGMVSSSSQLMNPIILHRC